MKLKFYGQWDHHIDPKGRITIPSRFKGEFKSRAIIVLDGEFLQIYPEEYIDIKKISPNKLWPTKIDRQGRILIPQKVRKEFGLQGPVTLFGQEDHLEIRSLKK